MIIKQEEIQIIQSSPLKSKIYMYRKQSMQDTDSLCMGGSGSLGSTSKEPWPHTTSAQMTVIDRPVRGSCCHVCSWLDSLNVFSFATGWILSKMENSQHSILGGLLAVSLSTVSLIGGACQSDLWLPEPNPATKVLYL